MMKWFTFENILDWAILFWWLGYIVLTWSHDLRGTWINPRTDAYERDRWITQWRKDFPDEELTIIVCTILLWIQAFASLRFTSLIGPMYSIAIRMLHSIIAYGLLLGSFLGILAFLATLLFRDLEEFKNF